MYSARPAQASGRDDLLAPLPGDDLAPLPTEDGLAPLPGETPRRPAFAVAAAPADADPDAESQPADTGETVPAADLDAVADLAARLLTPGAPKRPASGKPRAPRDKGSREAVEDLGYRFPYSRLVVEPVPDTSGAFGTAGTFAVRLAWHRGKAVLNLIESTALRPMAMVVLNGQKYPVVFSQHGRKKRDRILLFGKRKTTKSPRCALRSVAAVEGREDRLTWGWRIGATAAAMANAVPAGEDAPEDEVTLYLPFAPGRARVLHQPGSPNAFALWLNDLAMTVTVGRAEGVKEGFAAEPVLTEEPKQFALTLKGADLGGRGVSLTWETWVTPARTEAEVRAALLRHIADQTDRAQTPPQTFEGAPLRRYIQDAERVFMDDKMADKRGPERQAYRAAPGETKRHVAGEGADTALAVCALLGRYYQTGDDAVRRRARLISRDLCDFQVQVEESHHWGAIWDALHNKKTYADVNGQPTISVATTARTAKGLFIAHAHFGTEILSRTALAASQWLLLKMDRNGYIVAERFTEEGPPVEAEASPWVMCEALIPLVETFRSTENETFLKAALRIIKALQEDIAESRLPFERAPAEYLASAVEGVLLVSREYESQEMIALAKQVMLGLRVRRRPDGSVVDPPGVTTVSPLAPTLALARAALAITRVDDDPSWLLMALRAVRAAGRMADEVTAAGGWVNLADRANLMAMPTALLLATAHRVNGAEADRDRLTIKKGWQTFAPDPATREYVQVTAADGSEVDYLALVCPISLQVLISVVAPPHVAEVKVVKNGRSPFVKNLLNGDFDLTARLVPLGDGTEANVGVFIADT